MDPEISIIIPCFNRERFVGQAIQSALAQGGGVEVIAVDDGSTDRSWEIISSFPEVRAVRTSNRGAAAARNTGVGLARGSYLRFHDSDDLTPSAALSHLLESARSVEPKQIAFGDAHTIDERGQPCRGPSYGFGHLPAGPITIEQLTSGVMNTFLPLVPREAIEKVGGFDETLTISEDYELAARLAACGYQFVHVPVSVSEVREHSDARLSRSLGTEGYRRQMLAFSLAAQSIGGVSKSALEGVARNAWTAGREASREGCRPEAESLFRFAEGLVGHRAHVAKPLLRAAYWLVPPYAAERASEAVKTIGRRSFE